MALERRGGRRRRDSLLALVLMFSCHLLLAQEGGQICVLAFADRDKSGAREPGEVAITRGIGASLLSDRQVTIQAKLLEDSPFASDGLLCFDQLRAGRYQVVLTSNQYLPTGAGAFTAAVEPGSAPARIDYGVELMDLATSDADAPLIDRAAAEGLLSLALVAGGFSTLTLGGTGVVVYWLLIRRRLKRRPARPHRPAGAVAPAGLTGLSPQPLSQSSGAGRAPRRDPNQGSPPLFAEGEGDGL